MCVETLIHRDMCPSSFKEVVSDIISQKYNLVGQGLTPDILVTCYGFVDRAFKEALKAGDDETLRGLLTQFVDAMTDMATLNNTVAKCCSALDSVTSGGHYSLRMNYTSMAGRYSFLEDPHVIGAPVPGVSSRSLPKFPTLCDTPSASNLGIIRILETKVVGSTIMDAIMSGDFHDIATFFSGPLYEPLLGSLVRLRDSLLAPVNTISYRVAQVLFPVDDTEQNYHVLVPAVSSRVLEAMTGLMQTRYDKEAPTHYRIRSTQNGGSKPQNGGSICSYFRGVQPHFLSLKPVIRENALSQERYLNGSLGLIFFLRGTTKKMAYKLGKLEEILLGDKSLTSSQRHSIEEEMIGLGQDIIQDVLTPFMSAVFVAKDILKECGTLSDKIDPDVQRVILEILGAETQRETARIMEPFFLGVLRKNGCRFGDGPILDMVRAQVIKPFFM